MSPAHLRLNARKKYLTARFADRKQSYDPPENLSLFNPPLEAPEPTDKDLIRWVQRSLNNTQGTNLVTDGLITAEYGKALRDFNVRYNGRDYDDWDRRTQDDLIFSNEGNKKYIGWLTQALGRLGYGGFPPSEVITSMIVSAVRSFQSTSGLRVDGFVGPKTEFALINASGLEPPGALRRSEPRPKPGPKPTPNPERERHHRVLIRMLKEVPIYLEESYAKQMRLECLQEFIIRGLSGEKVDDRFWRFRGSNGMGKITVFEDRPCKQYGAIITLQRLVRPGHAIQNFERYCKNAKNVPNVAWCLNKVHDDILCHTNVLLGWANENKDDFPLRNWTECAYILELDAASRRAKPLSVYSCFASLLSDARGLCT